jgi:uncharacterized membrane protein
MADHLIVWLETLVRWFHVIAGAAWIGTSFYFNWLNNNLRPPEDPNVPPEVKSDLWAVHGGGFYRVVKYKVAPAKLPKTLHWFKWEAYFTWISGFALLSLVYFLGADVFLVDASKMELSGAAASGIGVGVLLVGWIVYDLLCKSPLAQKKAAFAVLGFLLVGGLSYGLCQIFSSRGAYILIGAMLGTMMAANVFFVIIPRQRIMVDQMIDGKEPDPSAGQAAALRSLHNNYFTLPVLFIMVSNHYPHTYGHAWDWAILAALGIISASVRHWFNLRGRGELNQWILPAAAIAMIALALVTAPQKSSAKAPDGPVTFQRVQTIVQARCTNCHAAQPSFPGYDAPPKNLLLDSPERIHAAASQIYQKAALTQYMPLGNLTKMTKEERAEIAKWFEDGAKTE